MGRLNNIYLLLLAIFAGSSFYLKAQNTLSSIHGQIELDSSWNRSIYLSSIPTMNERYTSANALILDEAQINSEGQFLLDISFLPKEEALYRIHIVKKGDPPASLIIGGKDENFKFLLLSPSSEVEINGNLGKSIFDHVSVRSDLPNQTLFEIDEWVSFADSSNFDSPELKKDLIQFGLEEKLRQIADSSSDHILALYALYQTDFNKHQKQHPTFYKDFLSKWKNVNSNYIKNFKTQIRTADPDNQSAKWLLLPLGILLGLLISNWKRFIPKSKDRVKLLSVQELKIYKSLQSGKSNKEISEEHNIGINTVKSHVSSILAKLKLKSRRDLFSEN